MMNCLSKNGQRVTRPATAKVCVSDNGQTVTSPGNAEILKNHKTAIFCSVKCPGDLIEI